MSENTEKKTLFNDFINKASNKLIKSKEHQTRELIIPSLIEGDDEATGKVKIRALTAAEINEVVDMENDPRDANTGDVYAVYLAMVEPNLKDAAKILYDQGKLDRYLDIVHMFDHHEINEITQEILKLSGVVGDKKVKVVENLKN